MRLSVLLPVTTAVIALASPTYAQTGPATSGDETATGGVSDIVVTARRRSENIQNVPLSVTGISSATLEQ